MSFGSIAAALVLSTAALVSVASADEGPALPHPPTLPAELTRQVEIEMGDYFFKPDAVQVKVGETITFNFTNSGKEVHDAFIGDQHAQDHHEEEMNSGHAHSHDGPDAVTVAPGESGSIQHFFDKAETLQIGCHVKGHYVVGMVMTVTATMPVG